MMVYVPCAAVVGTCQADEYVCVWPALNAWLSQNCWKTFTDEESYTSTSTSTVDVWLLVTVDVIDTVWPEAALVGAAVALLVYVAAGTVAVTVGVAGGGGPPSDTGF